MIQVTLESSFLKILSSVFPDRFPPCLPCHLCVSLFDLFECFGTLERRSGTSGFEFTKDLGIYYFGKAMKFNVGFRVSVM